MASPLATNSTPVNTSLPPRPFSFAASTSAGSGLASRRRNNKNLSLCLTNSARLCSAPATPHFRPPQTGPYHDGPVRIMPYLYLGAEKNTLDLDQLRQLSIQCMLNVAAEVQHPHEHLFSPLDNPVIPSPSLSRASTASSVASSLNTITPPDSAASSPRPIITTDAAFSPRRRQASIGSSDQHPYNIIGYKKLSWEHNQDNLVQELDEAIATIDRARDAGQTILVHCQCGVARSATVIIAYVMKTLRLPMQEAYDYVKERAPAISPNLGLLYQLREYEQKLQNNETSILYDTPSYDDDNGPSAPLTDPIAPARPVNKLFSFRPSSISLAWKRKMAKTTKKVLSLGNSIADDSPPQPENRASRNKDCWS